MFRFTHFAFGVLPNPIDPPILPLVAKVQIKGESKPTVYCFMKVA